MAVLRLLGKTFGCLAEGNFKLCIQGCYVCEIRAEACQSSGSRGLCE